MTSREDKTLGTSVTPVGCEGGERPQGTFQADGKTGSRSWRLHNSFTQLYAYQG